MTSLAISAVVSGGSTSGVAVGVTVGPPGVGVGVGVGAGVRVGVGVRVDVGSVGDETTIAVGVGGIVTGVGVGGNVIGVGVGGKVIAVGVGGRTNGVAVGGADVQATTANRPAVRTAKASRLRTLVPLLRSTITSPGRIPPA